MSKLFFSYRRVDSPDTTARIYERLVDRFGKKNIFKDIDSIGLGLDFRKKISDSVQKCDVILAIIGTEWLFCNDEKDNRRLDDPNDYVRIELEVGLERDIHVIPVLINHANIPAEIELPDSLKQLAYRNAAIIRPEPDFNTDVNRLIRKLEEILNINDSIFRRILSHLYSFKIPYVILLILLILIPGTQLHLPKPWNLSENNKNQRNEIPTYLVGKWKGKIQSSFISYDIELTFRENNFILEEKSAFSKCIYRLNMTDTHNSSTTFNASLTGDPQDKCINNTKITLNKSDNSHIDYQGQEPLGLISSKGRLYKVDP